MTTRRSAWIVFSALAVAQAWGASPDRWKSKLQDAVNNGLQPQTVAELRTRMDADKQAGGEDLTHFDVTLNDIQDFTQKFQAAKAAQVVPNDQVDDFKSRLEDIMSALDMKKDPALEAAYIGQLAPPPEAQAEIQKRMDDLNKQLSKQGHADEYLAKTQEIQGLISSGNWKDAYSKFHSTFDGANLSRDAQGDANVIDRAMMPRPVSDANQFTDYRQKLQNGLDMVKVPVPYNTTDKQSWDVAKGGEKAGKWMGGTGAGAAGAGVASAAGIIDIPLSAAAIGAGLLAMGGGYIVYRFGARTRQNIEERPENDDPLSGQ